MSDAVLLETIIYVLASSIALGFCQFHQAGSQRGAIHRPTQLDNVTEIIRTVLDGYDIRLRPQFGGEPLSLGMDIAIASFDSISEVNMDYTLTLYLNQYWADERLAFAKDKDYDLTLSGDFAERIWVPDTFFANDKNSFLHEVTEKNKMVRLKSNGSIAYGMRFTTTLACMMDLHYYPLDSQNCTVEIESYGYTVSDVKMHWTSTPVVGVEEAELPQFSILRWETTDRIEKLATGMYQRLSLSFELKRNIGYFIFQTYLPSILIVMLSWVSFWINHEATSARVALGITTVLTMTTISTGVRSSLPRISYVKAIDIYLVMSFVFVFAALLEYAAVNYTYWGARAKKKPKRPTGHSFDRATGEMLQATSLISSGHPPGGQVIARSTSSLAGTPGLAGMASAVAGEASSYSNEEIIELHDIRSSPIACLRNRKNTSLNQSSSVSEPELRFPPSFRMASNTSSHRVPHGQTGGGGGRNVHYGPGSTRARYGRGGGSGDPRSKPSPRVLQTLRKGASAFKVSIPRIKDVNTIDKYSRVIFPVSFIVFNLCYWSFYIW